MVKCVICAFDLGEEEKLSHVLWAGRTCAGKTKENRAMYSHYALLADNYIGRF